MPTLAQEVLLIALDDETGRLSGWTASSVDYGLAGATLLDLLFAGRIEITDDRVVVRDAAPTGDAAMDAVLQRLAEREKPRKPADWVGRLYQGIRKRVAAGLEEQGLVRAERKRALGLIASTRYPEADPSAERSVRDRVRAVLVDRAEPDERTAALIAVAYAGDLGRALIPDRPWKEIKPRVKEVAEGDWAAEAVRKAIQSVNAAILVATAAASSAAVSGS